MRYLNPCVRSEKFNLGPTLGQYILEITPDCPTFLERGLTFDGQTAVFCSEPDSESGSFQTATLICSNIDGEFTLSTGAIVSGGGLTCPDGLESFTQPFSIEPSLPRDCVVDQVLFNTGNSIIDACDIAG